MGRPNPVTDAERDQVRQLHAAGKGRNDIARELHRSGRTISEIAAALGLTFDRTAVRAATEAAQADNKARRQAMAARFLDEATELLDAIHKPHVVFNIGGKDNVYTDHEMLRPPTADIRNLVVSAAVLFDKHLAQQRHDADDQHGLTAVDQWLRSITGG